MKLKKISKNLKKTPKNPPKYLKKAWREFREEAEDFFEDLVDDLFESSRKKRRKKLKQIRLYGMMVLVRPAYIFAERVENFLKIIIGFSIIISGVIATFFGFTRTSELLGYLILSIPGRIIMIIIGASYLLIGIWKLFNIKT